MAWPGRVVNGARPDHHHQPVILAMQHARDGGAAGFDQLLRLFGHGQPLFQQCRGQQRAHDLDVVRVLSSVVSLGWACRPKLRWDAGASWRMSSRYCRAMRFNPRARPHRRLR
jgi:hypothetical protein